MKEIEINERAVYKLDEIIGDLESLVETDFKDSNLKLSHIDNRVSLWARSVYGEEGKEMLNLSGYWKDANDWMKRDDIIGRPMPTVGQKKFDINLEHKINALLSLMENLLSFGTGLDKEFNIRTESEFKFGYDRVLSYSRKKIKEEKE